MAYIAPNSTINIYKGVPLDSTYNNSVLFSTKEAQLSAFDTYKKYTFDNYTYQRVKDNTIRVSMVADNLYDCNYMIFRNTNYGNKWFYAFINKVTYINNATTEIEYDIDRIQTFWFDFEIPPCFVEREHALTDVIGDNLVPEPIAGGTMTLVDEFDIKFQEFTTCIKYVPRQREEYIVSLFYNHDTGTVDFTMGNMDDLMYGQYQYLMYNGYVRLNIPKYTYDTQPVREYTPDEVLKMINASINKIIDIGGTIVDIVKVPDLILADADFSVIHPNPLKITQNYYEEEEFYDEAHISSYIPKNKKLYTSPYKKLIVSNNAGQTTELEFEKFRDFDDRENGNPEMKKCDFSLSGICDPEVECTLYPFHYRGMENGDYENGLIFRNFLHSTWDEDSFKMWWQINCNAYITSLGTTVLAGVASTIANIATDNVPMTIMSAGMGVMNVANKAMELDRQSRMPHQLAGQASTSTIQFWQHRVGFKLYEMGIEYDLARTADDFFTKYGYAQNQIKVPEVKKTNRTLPLRPYWNYIKTSECYIKPYLYLPTVSTNTGLTADDIEKIQNIFNKGITFWNNILMVGDYSQDNSIIETEGD